MMTLNIRGLEKRIQRTKDLLNFLGDNMSFSNACRG